MRMYVCINNTFSETSVNVVRVSQGSTLGPLLFWFYIDKIPKMCPPHVT